MSLRGPGGGGGGGWGEAGKEVSHQERERESGSRGGARCDSTLLQKKKISDVVRCVPTLVALAAWHPVCVWRCPPLPSVFTSQEHTRAQSGLCIVSILVSFLFLPPFAPPPSFFDRLRAFLLLSCPAAGFFQPHPCLSLWRESPPSPAPTLHAQT